VNKLRVLDLFSGIGGFSLGLERTGGFETVAFCEIEEFPRRVLAKHWPSVPCYRDVRELTAERLAADGIAVDAICGGFPCQDISVAGKGAGLAGERSGLWSEIARLVGELAPRFVIVENVAALLGRGLGDVLGDLASLGYDAEWHCIPASAVGAPHRRDRVWIVAYAAPAVSEWCGFAWAGRHGLADCGSALADASLLQRDGRELYEKHCEGTVPEFRDSGCAGNVADAVRGGRQGQGQPIYAKYPAPLVTREAIESFHGCVAGFWRAEPELGRVANGVPDRAHRLKGLGNAVVPQIPELIGNAILAAINSRAADPLPVAADDCGTAEINPLAVPPFSDDRFFHGGTNG